jgi:outer membrane protein assembly factor BamB
MPNWQNNKVSRRDFLKKAGVAAGGVAAASLSACAASTTTIFNTTATTITGTTTVTTPITTTVTQPVTTTVTSTVPTTVTQSGGTSAIPPEVTQYAADWPLPQGNYASTRATTTSSINSGNVNTLGLAWSVPLAGAISTNPIIMGNTVFLQDNSYNIWSIDFTTGKVNWNVTNNHPWIGPAGVCVAYGTVYGSSNSYDLAAYDMATGKIKWSSVISNANADTHSDIQPIPYNGQVFTSAGPHVGGTQFGGMDGYLWGIDATTGKVNWATSTTASRNFFGHPELSDGSGAWFPPSIDTNTGNLFWGTKNPGGFGYGGVGVYSNASQRPGANLYSNCILNTDSDTGDIIWFNQTFPHDLVDHDFMNTPILTTAPNLYGMGQAVDIAIGGGKAGVCIAFDRTTGSTLWKTPVGKHSNDTLGWFPTQPIQVYPGVLGGIESHMAYANGMVFVPYDDIWTTYSDKGLQAVQPPNQATGGLAALDVNTGNILWDNKLPALNVGAATVVNDLVFTATYDGMMYAFKAADGTKVWSAQGPGGINSWPSVAKDTILFPFGVGSNPQLIALKLGATGKIPTPPPPTTAPTTTSAPPSTTSTAINLVALNIAFNTSNISVKAGSGVVINFNNKDNQIPHNFSVYTDSTATTAIFVGQVIIGPGTITYTFTAPSKAGNYFFRCDVHPTIMTGTFVVT